MKKGFLFIAGALFLLLSGIASADAWSDIGEKKVEFVSQENGWQLFKVGEVVNVEDSSWQENEMTFIRQWHTETTQKALVYALFDTTAWPNYQNNILRAVEIKNGVVDSQDAKKIIDYVWAGWLPSLKVETKTLVVQLEDEFFIVSEQPGAKIITDWFMVVFLLVWAISVLWSSLPRMSNDHKNAMFFVCLYIVLVFGIIMIGGQYGGYSHLIVRQLLCVGCALVVVIFIVTEILVEVINIQRIIIKILRIILILIPFVFLSWLYLM